MTSEAREARVARRKVLVTGAAGFIGSHVVRALVADGHDVRALHLPSDDLRNLRGLPIELVSGDVTDAAAVRAAVTGTSWVFHLAAIYALWMKDPSRMRRVNVEGTRTVLAAARDAGARVVHTSSIARFGGQGRGRRATEDSPYALGPTGDTYANTKNEAHEVAVAASREHDVVIVAPTGPIGPGDVGPTPTGKLLLECATMPVAVLVDTVSNFADVRAMARAHVTAAERGERGRVYLLGERDVSLVEMTRIAHDVLGVPLARLRRVVVPYAAASAFGHAALAYTTLVSGRTPLLTPAAVRIARLGLAADCARARRELAMPSMPIEGAVRDALAWFAREGYVRDHALARRILRRRGSRSEA